MEKTPHESRGKDSLYGFQLQTGFSHCLFSELLARPSYGLLISITHFALKQRKEMVARIPIFIDYYFFELS